MDSSITPARLPGLVAFVRWCACVCVCRRGQIGVGRWPVFLASRRGQGAMRCVLPATDRKDPPVERVGRGKVEAPGRSSRILVCSACPAAQEQRCLPCEPTALLGKGHALRRVGPLQVLQFISPRQPCTPAADTHRPITHPPIHPSIPTYPFIHPSTHSTSPSIFSTSLAPTTNPSKTWTNPPKTWTNPPKTLTNPTKT